MKIQEQITQKLKQAFNPEKVEVINESHQHSVAAGSETHFKIIVVSEKFQDLSLIQRHRAVYDILKFELANGVHALAIHSMTPAEFNKKQNEDFKSPPCLGGSKN